MYLNLTKTKTKISLCVSIALTPLLSPLAYSATFNMQKNGTEYSIDGENCQSMYLWDSNSDNVNQQWEWSNLDDSSSTTTSSTDYDLDSSVAPSSNIDLSDWYLSVPTDTDDSGYADSIKEAALNDDYESDYFYTGSDGAMVFMCTVDGYKTSSSTTYTRTELREMLRAGDTSIDTDDKENNWAFSSIDSDDQSDFGGIDGTLTATVAVNHVTTTSTDDEQRGRIIIGQIHAENNEPLRLYLNDKTSDGDDYSTVSFYKLTNTHN